MSSTSRLMKEGEGEEDDDRFEEIGSGSDWDLESI